MAQQLRDLMLSLRTQIQFLVSTQDNSQLPITPIARDSVPSSGLHGHMHIPIPRNKKIKIKL